MVYLNISTLEIKENRYNNVLYIDKEYFEENSKVNNIITLINNILNERKINKIHLGFQACIFKELIKEIHSLTCISELKFDFLEKEYIIQDNIKSYCIESFYNNNNNNKNLKNIIKKLEDSKIEYFINKTNTRDNNYGMYTINNKYITKYTIDITANINNLYYAEEIKITRNNYSKINEKLLDLIVKSRILKTIYFHNQSDDINIIIDKLQYNNILKKISIKQLHNNNSNILMNYLCKDIYNEMIVDNDKRDLNISSINKLIKMNLDILIIDEIYIINRTTDNFLKYNLYNNINIKYYNS